ncbi:MAG: hypothetical protein ACRBEQ_09555 [Hyphomonas sp.]
MSQAKRGVVALALLGAMSVSACAMLDNKPPVTTYKLLAAASDIEPVSVAMPLVATRGSGTQYNQWGGTIPEAKPTVPVDDGGLGEIYD